jgi:hypothetical protein
MNFDTACKHNGNKAYTLGKYREAQNSLKAAILKQNKEQVESTFEKILSEGGVKSQTFWQTRRKILGANKPPEYDTIDEDGVKIIDPDKSKEHIASYFEQLYKARESDDTNQQTTKEISKNIIEWENLEEYNQTQPPITIEELNKIIKKLKKGKSCGPDEIPNDVFIMADDQTKQIYLTTLNKILQSQQIPENWQLGTVTRIYKNKGTKGKCSNERGITVSSNFGKLFERIINEQAKKVTNVSDAQAGGKEKRSTTDHLLILKEIIRDQKRKRHPLYLVFLDVTKAFDKAWLDGIMHAMHNNGLTGPLWNITRKMNLNLKATIKTKDCTTRQIAMTRTQS